MNVTNTITLQPISNGVLVILPYNPFMNSGVFKEQMKEYKATMEEDIELKELIDKGKKPEEKFKVQKSDEIFYFKNFELAYDFIKKMYEIEYEK